MRKWEIYAIRYATYHGRSTTFFEKPDLIADIPMSLDFFVWALCSDERTIVVDTGFSAHSSVKRGRPLECEPAEAIANLGLAPHGIGDVILTHLHFDHAGNVGAFPDARIHVQEAEMQFATGRNMCDPAQRLFFEPKDLADIAEALHADRIVFHASDDEIAEGVSVHLLGGHTAGTQVVRVFTERGWVVLASDASHFYANMILGNPYPAVWEQQRVFEGYTRLGELADSPDHIIPGHDPQVRQLYPELGNTLNLDVACLHLPPSGAPMLDQLTHKAKH